MGDIESMTSKSNKESEDRMDRTWLIGPASQIEALQGRKHEVTLLPGTAKYKEVLNGYWSKQQAESQPSAIFQPRDAQDVAFAVGVLQRTRASFAIKSGGHGRWLNESSCSDGILIDSHHMRHLELSEDRSSIRVGPGNRWKHVYGLLEPQGLMAVGGRVADVGVGGFLTSGR
ncbi:FAD-dependent monooxygenase yanF, partial [Pseudocercospora fuligena]